MPNEDLSKLHFQKKISTYCDVRIAPVAPDWVVENIRPYLLGLITFKKTPALASNRYDWRQIAHDCGIDEALTTKLKKQLRPALDAIMRWLKEPPVEDDARKGRRLQAAPKSGDTGQFTPSPTNQHHEVEEVESSPSPGRPGPKPRPVSDKPEPLFEANDDPSSFADALAYQMRRFGESYWQLHRAVVRLDETFDAKTLLSWIEGQRVPRSVASFDILCRIERRYGLERGYFKAKLPHQSRSLYGHDLEDISLAERRRLAWHLPDDFGSLPFSKREEILEWVRRVIISGSTDYRRFQAAATKQRYAIRFPGITYGGSALTPRLAASSWLRDEDEKGPTTEALEDPDLLSGVVDAPPRLAMEMADLIRFKTSTLTEIGYRRNGVWNEETASQKIEHLGLMFGALAASPNGVVKGRGVQLSQLTFGLLIFPGVWDWYLQWRERRRGFFTKWEEDMLMVAMALTRAEVGWIRQHPELLRNVKPIEGLITTDEIDAARRDWHGACEDFHRHAANRSKEIQRVMRVHRDPFEPIMCVLEADSPLAEYRKITEEILKRMPDEHRYPRAAAEAVRSFLMLRLGLHLGLRQKNLRQLLVCPRGQFPTAERRLEDMKRGELRWNERERGWEVFIPSNAFKNSGSSFFGQKPFRLVLPDLLDLYTYLNAYIERHRKVLLGRGMIRGRFSSKPSKRPVSMRRIIRQHSTRLGGWRSSATAYTIRIPAAARLRVCYHMALTMSETCSPHTS